ncbi:MAG: GNAT family N-acetyltransferase [Candidatus Nanoarchaeia archaeon]|nr:GNAT family N-acetyltransferase [Candidatus Nanoarchaeia archaeon]
MLMEIKKATLKNLKEIISLNQQLFDYEYANFDKTLNCKWPSKNIEYYKKSITNKESITLLAFIDGKIVGYLIGAINKTESYRNIKKIAEIDNMFILPQFRGLNIGSSLYNKFINWMKTKGIKKIRVIASSKNGKAIDFYKKNGFLEYNLTLEKDI